MLTMPFFKDMQLKQKKSKSLNIKNEMFSRTGVYDETANNNNNNSRNSFTALMESPSNSRTLARSSSYADNEAVLLNAVAREDTSAVRKTLETGKVDVNVIRNGMGPIHHACISGNVNIVKLLLRYEADINLKTKQEKTPIKLAVLHGHFELAEYLIAMGGEDKDIVHGVC